MRVFVTGATGFIGTAVVAELLGAGHDVIGLARSDASADALKRAGARVHRGSLEDLESLRRGAALAEGAIHTAFFHEFTHAALSTRLRVLFGGAPSGIITRFLGAAAEADRQAIAAIASALRGSDRSLVVACGTMSMRAGAVATEDDEPDPASAGGRRTSEAATLATASSGIRASVIRLPPLVHGEGDRSGFAPRLIEMARKKRVSAMVGDGHNRWPSVHRQDAARLFRAALERGAAGSRYHAVAEEGTPFCKLAEIIGERLGVPVASYPAREASKHFSWLGTFVSVDNPASSALTSARLGWKPEGPTLGNDLDGPWYFRT